MDRLRRRPLGRYRYVRLRWRLLFAAIDLVGGWLLRLVRAWRVASGEWRVSPLQEGEGASTILLVQLDHLGDAVLSTTLLPPLRRRYPRASLEVLTSPWNEELFASAPEVDRVHVLAKSRFVRPRCFGALTAMLWCGWQLRRRKIDLAIDVRGEFPIAVLIWLSGARRRLGWHCGGGGFLLTDSPAYLAGRPEVESRWALLATLGIYPAPGEVFSPAVSPPETVRRRVAQWLDTAGQASSGTQGVGRVDGHRREALVGEPHHENSPEKWWGSLRSTHPTTAQFGGRLRIAAHVGAGTAAKQWPADHWRELIARLVVRLGAEVVLVGGRGERTIARRILDPSPYSGVIDWTGQLGVGELAAVIEQSDLFVGADSGPAHLAAAVGTPAVVLFSGTNDPQQWRPWGTGVMVVRREVRCSPCHRERCPLQCHPCMRGLEVEEVAQAVEEASAGRVGRAQRAPPREFARKMVGLAALDPPYYARGDGG
jgi:ADP-heptose:LPS heptosyltransferase